MNNFSVTQRRFLADNFKDALINANPQGRDYFKKLQATTQAIMREAVHFTCLYKPLEGKITEEKYQENGESQVREFVTIAFEIMHPGTGDIIKLERKFTKSNLEQR
jgi:hypothetical protein